MDSTYTTKALVLKSQPRNDSDARVVFYSLEAGRLELVARGTAKPASRLAAHLQPFNLVDLLVARGRRWDYAAAAISLTCFSRLKSDYDKLAAAGVVWRLADHLLKTGEADQRLFVLFNDFLFLLNQVKSTPLYYQTLAGLTIIKLLTCLGLCPDFAALKPRQIFDVAQMEPSAHPADTTASLGAAALTILIKARQENLFTLVRQLKITPAVARQLNNFVGLLAKTLL